MNEEKAAAQVPPVSHHDLSKIHELLEAHQALFTVGHQRMNDIQAEQAVQKEAIAENTAITTDVRDILAAVKTGLKVLGGLGIAARWVGWMAAAATTVWGLIQAITHQGGQR